MRLKGVSLTRMGGTVKRGVGAVLAVAALILTGCPSPYQVSQFDQSMYDGLGKARTMFNEYMGLNPHNYSSTFYLHERALVGTLLAQAKNNPQNDSATVEWLTIIDSSLSRLQMVEVYGDTTYAHLSLFAEIVNADFDVAIYCENAKRRPK